MHVYQVDELSDKMLPCVLGYHIYYFLWDSCIYKEKCSVVKVGRHNFHNQFAASVKKGDIIVGYLHSLKDFSHVHSIFKVRFADCHGDLLHP